MPLPARLKGRSARCFTPLLLGGGGATKWPIRFAADALLPFTRAPEPPRLVHTSTPPSFSDALRSRPFGDCKK
uniref:Putative secreted protein n=1 Tax=Anopheles darlingi TaxID=43151 RepID=A0A2M4DLT5_ANODA